MKTASIKRNVIVFSVVAGTLLHFPSQSPAADTNDGAQLAAMCAACHRLDGHDSGIPSIIGLDPNDLAAKLEAFRTGESQSLLMHGVALSLTEAESASVARYLSTLRKDSER